MASIEFITRLLHEGLYDYAPNRNKKEYREKIINRKRFTSKFALDFFPRYIDFEK